MKHFISVMIFLSVCASGFSQNRTARQERIEQWKKDMEEFRQRSDGDRAAGTFLDSLSWMQAGDGIAKRAFVMEADAVTFKTGARVIVNESTNFISVNGDRGVVQISPSPFLPGPNGVGGITVEGTVSGFETNVDRKGVMHITMNIVGRAVNATVDITLYPGGNDAYAVVSPNFNSMSVRLEGKLVPYNSTRTVEGMVL